MDKRALVTAAGLKQLFGVGPAVWKAILLIAVLSWGAPEILKLLHVDQGKHGKLAFYHGMRGPWLGEIGADKSWIHVGHSTDPSVYAVHAGDTIVWDSWNDVEPGTEVHTIISLWCGPRMIFSAEHVLPRSEVRQGWKTFALSVPHGTPANECGVRREAHYDGANGAHEDEYGYSIINIRIVDDDPRR